MLFNNWPHLYAESVVDVGDVAEEIGKAQGGYYDVSPGQLRTTARSGIAVPWSRRRRA